MRIEHTGGMKKEAQYERNLDGKRDGKFQREKNIAKKYTEETVPRSELDGQT